jgi:hypothetical protein
VIETKIDYLFAPRQRISLGDKRTVMQLPKNQQMGNKNPAKNKIMVTGNEDSSSMTS